jgi:hypothetical protein
VIAEVRDLFLARVDQAIRAAGVDSPVSIAALRAGAVQLLDQMTTEGARSGFALANSLTASQIRLVDDNQLELSIRLGDIANTRAMNARLHSKFHRVSLRCSIARRCASPTTRCRPKRSAAPWPKCSVPRIPRTRRHLPVWPTSKRSWPTNCR